MPAIPTRMRIAGTQTSVPSGRRFTRGGSDVDVRDGGRLRESVALVHDLRVVAELGEVLAAVVGAEEQLTADVERRANIGLGTTAVSADLVSYAHVGCVGVKRCNSQTRRTLPEWEVPVM